MKNIFPRWFANRKSRIERRLDKSKDAIADAVRKIKSHERGLQE